MPNRSVTQTLSGGNIVATLAFIDVEAYLLFRSHTHSGCDHPQCPCMSTLLADDFTQIYRRYRNPNGCTTLHRETFYDLSGYLPSVAHLISPYP
jgi:hypothetical protein